VFPVQDSTLSATALAALLHRLYAMTDDPTCVFWRKGMGDTYRIDAGATERHRRALGRMAARMHQCADGLRNSGSSTKSPRG